MGVIKQGILGGFSGKVAGVVGSSWKGIAYMKALPLSVANPQTSGQVAQRTKFTNVSQFASSILASIVKPLWDRFAQQQSGYNAFVQTNIDLFENEVPAPASDLVISSGKMAITEFAALSLIAAQPNVIMYWDDDAGEGFKLATDEVYALAINATQGIYSVSSADATRADGEVTVVLDEDMVAADVIYAYLAFSRADGTVVSDTSYKTDNAA